MLDQSELRVLVRWCRARRLQWQPGVADDGRPAILLLGGAAMQLLPDDDGWQLLDADGQTLAAASDLGGLLDALDAGVAEPAPAWPHRAPPARHTAFAPPTFAPPIFAPVVVWN